MTRVRQVPNRWGRRARPRENHRRGSRIGEGGARSRRLASTSKADSTPGSRSKVGQRADTERDTHGSFGIEVPPATVSRVLSFGDEVITRRPRIALALVSEHPAALDGFKQVLV